MARTSSTDHEPGTMPTVTDHDDRDAALRHADHWTARHRAHGCTVEWFPGGRVVATHYAHRVAAVMVIDLTTGRTPMHCRYCGRAIERDEETGRWVDPEATGDDAIWRETCDAHDTFEAEHEPVDVMSTAS